MNCSENRFANLIDFFFFKPLQYMERFALKNGCISLCIPHVERLLTGGTELAQKCLGAGRGARGDHPGDKPVTSLCHPFLRGPVLARGLPGIQQLVSTGEQSLSRILLQETAPRNGFQKSRAASRGKGKAWPLSQCVPSLGGEDAAEARRRWAGCRTTALSREQACRVSCRGCFFTNANELF